jgi:hypothetical protein
MRAYVLVVDFGTREYVDIVEIRREKVARHWTLRRRLLEK